MAWTSPMTAVANTPMTAALYNANVRDNLRCEAPYLTGSVGDTYVVRRAKTIVSRTVEFATVTTPQTTTSTTYVDLATVGPTITVSEILGQQAMVWISAEVDNDTADAQSVATLEVSGAAAYAAVITRSCVVRDALAANKPIQYMACYLFDPISRGKPVTFTMKYRVGSGTGTFANRRMAVWPL